MNILFLLPILSGIIALVCLIALHSTSPEYQPSWRMISEYAMGKYKWLITLFFYLWGISSILLALGLSTIVSGVGAYLGIGLLIISGIGAICGGAFDVNHKNHGLAFARGLPTLPIAAVLLTYHLITSNSISQKNALVAAHATWISVIIMAISTHIAPPKVHRLRHMRLCLLATLENGVLVGLIQLCQGGDEVQNVLADPPHPVIRQPTINSDMHGVGLYANPE